MEELIKSFAHDVRVISEHRAAMTPFSNMEVCLYGKETFAKVALGRTLLALGEKDFSNADRAISAAEDYLKENA